MILQESDTQAGNAVGEYSVKRFVAECRKHPRFLDEPVGVMQIVYHEMFGKAQPRSWEQQVGKRDSAIR